VLAYEAQREQDAQASQTHESFTLTPPCHLRPRQALLPI
jgi:hypothetical protein